jgi:hypothetical protein
MPSKRGTDILTHPACIVLTTVDLRHDSCVMHTRVSCLPVQHAYSNTRVLLVLPSAFSHSQLLFLLLPDADTDAC